MGKVLISRCTAGSQAVGFGMFDQHNGMDESHQTKRKNMSSYSPYCTIMGFYNYLEHLLEIRIEYKGYRNVPRLFFTQCIGGNSNPIIKDLTKLVECPTEKYGSMDWKLLKWVDMKVKGVW